MGIFTSETFNSLDDLFVFELKDLYDAEKRITEALPKMAKKAHNPRLKEGFQHHLDQTEKHVERLESIFQHRGIEAERETCDAMVGLLKEGSTILDAEGESDVLDAALIAAAQRVEHYEIAGYGTARAVRPATRRSLFGRAARTNARRREADRSAPYGNRRRRGEPSVGVSCGGPEDIRGLIDRMRVRHRAPDIFVCLLFSFVRTACDLLWW